MIFLNNIYSDKYLSDQLSSHTYIFIIQKLNQEINEYSNNDYFWLY